MKLAHVISVLALGAATGLAQETTKFDSIKATDLSGKAVTIPTAGKITAVVFIATKCPVSNDYNERMTALYNDYKDRVQFVFLNANVSEPADEVARHAKDVGFTFPVYKDVNNVEADRFRAEFTPHAFVIGKDSKLAYRGGIDDQRNAAKVTQKSMREVLDALIAGKPAPYAETKAFGCTIKRISKQS